MLPKDRNELVHNTEVEIDSTGEDQLHSMVTVYLNLFSVNK